jgi:hypothetical protein
MFRNKIKNAVNNIKVKDNSEIRHRGQEIKERDIKRLEAAQMGLLGLLLSTVLQDWIHNEMQTSGRKSMLKRTVVYQKNWLEHIHRI